MARQEKHRKPKGGHPQQAVVVTRYGDASEPRDPVHGERVQEMNDVEESVARAAQAEQDHLTGHDHHEAQERNHGPRMVRAAEEAVEREEVAEVVRAVEEDALHLHDVRQVQHPVGHGLVENHHRLPDPAHVQRLVVRQGDRRAEAAHPRGCVLVVAVVAVVDELAGGDVVHVVVAEADYGGAAGAWTGGGGVQGHGHVVTAGHLPHRHLKHGQVGHLPHRHRKHGQVGHLSHRHLKHGQVGHLPHRHLKHGQVGHLPQRHLKHGQVGYLPQTHLKHGQVVRVGHLPYRHWKHWHVVTTEYLLYKHLKHGQVGHLPHRHRKHGQVVRAGHLPYRHWKQGHFVTTE